MSTRHLVDPELLPGLDMFPPFAFSRETLPALRQSGEEAFLMMKAHFPPTQVVTEERTIPGGDGQDMIVVIYRPPNLAPSAPAICHMHGGGYVFGSARMTEPTNNMLAEELGALIVSVDYRLAPENPHPAPVEDCYAALKWMADNAAELGIDPNRIAIKGESAGGGLAAALAWLARDRGGPAICHQNLIYPMIDDRTGTTSDPHPHVGEFVWTPEANRLGWEYLLGHEPGRDTPAPYAASARMESVAGLPSTFILTGSLDLFVEENIEYARRLMREGVSTELHVYPGVYHGFVINAASTAVQNMNRDMLAAFRKAFGIDKG